MGKRLVVRDRYRLEDELRATDRSAVWKAVDLKTQRRCVVKSVCLDAAGSEAGAESLAKESGILANLNHPGIPCFVESFAEKTQSGATLYCVYEYVEGRSIVEQIEGGRHFKELDVQQLTRDLALILKYLHGFSPPIIHSDIRPGHIIVDAQNRPHLISFGAVKRRLGWEPEGALARGAEALAYEPREQSRGEANVTSDIYALGASMLYALSQVHPDEMPHDGERLDFRRLVNVTGPFAEVLERMVEPDWEKRYQSAGDLLRDLDRLLAPPQVRPPARRRPLLPLVSLAVFVLIAILVLLGIHRTQQVTPSPPVARQPTPRPASAPSLGTDKAVYAPNEPIVVTFSGMPGAAQDWLTIAPAGSSAQTYGQWFFTGGKAEGTLTFHGLAPGHYEVRAYYDWPGGGYDVIGRWAITVEQSSPNSPPRQPNQPPRATAGGAQGPVVRGRTLFNGTLLPDVTQVEPSFWFRNEERNVVETPVVRYSEGGFTIHGLPEGTMGMSVIVDKNPENGYSYPGDLRTWEVFEVKQDRTEDLVVELREIIHLTLPQDNGSEIDGWDADCMDKTAFASPVTFAWEPLMYGAEYSVRVEVMNSLDHYNTITTLVDKSTPDTSVTVDLPPSRTNECYGFHIQARNGRTPVGMLITHGRGGYGWDYRFRVAR
ncbi:MAG: hypothetical protein AB1714_19915 [Acidobacteriota bacterium]